MAQFRWCFDFKSSPALFYGFVFRPIYLGLMCYCESGLPPHQEIGMPSLSPTMTEARVIHLYYSPFHVSAPLHLISCLVLKGKYCKVDEKRRRKTCTRRCTVRSGNCRSLFRLYSLLLMEFARSPHSGEVWFCALPHLLAVSRIKHRLKWNAWRKDI